MSIKFTNEAPVGMKAGMKRSYAWINQVKSRTKTLNPEHQTPNTKHQTLNTKHQKLNTQDQDGMQDMLDIVARPEWKTLLCRGYC